MRCTKCGKDKCFWRGTVTSFQDPQPRFAVGGNFLCEACTGFEISKETKAARDRVWGKED